MARIFRFAIIGAVALLIVLGLLWAFRFIGTPQEQRALRLDMQRIQRIQAMTEAIGNYYRKQDKHKLPDSIEEIRANPSVNYSYIDDIYEDPLTGKLFEYRRTSENEFEICAEFQTDFHEREKRGQITSDTAAQWMHKKGRTCFRFRISRAGEISRVSPKDK